jgi:peptidoglycan/LPS O-acetylase OafA/YrhL
MDALAIGAIIAWFESRNLLSNINFNIVIIICLLLMVPAWVYTGGKGYSWIQVFKFPIISFFYMGVIGKIVSQKSWLNRFFSSPILSFTGKISYGLYVWHPMCFMIFYHYFPGHSIWINAMACYVISYIAAIVSFYAFERHFIKLKHFFEPKSQQKAQVTVL